MSAVNQRPAGLTLTELRPDTPPVLLRTASAAFLS